MASGIVAQRGSSGPVGTPESGSAPAIGAAASATKTATPPTDLTPSMIQGPTPMGRLPGAVASHASGDPSDTDSVLIRAWSSQAVCLGDVAAVPLDNLELQIQATQTNQTKHIVEADPGAAGQVAAG
jgi:hypothetical protein